MTAELNDMDKRKLVTVRTIDDLAPIPGADAIEVATIEGWKVVVKKGEFKIGDKCVYFEIDSFLPDGNPAWQFLVDKQGREFEGKRGHRLKTIKLRGQLSQGFVVPLDALPSVVEFIFSLDQDDDLRTHDLSDLVGVVKWDPPLPASLAGQAAGLFPSFIRKTDQERCQNLGRAIFGYEDQLFPFDVSTLSEDAITTMQDRGLLEWVGDGLGGKWHKVIKAEASPLDAYEITMKMDGSSATFFHRDGHLGVCSRNLELKIGDENKDNSFVRMLYDGLLNVLLPELGNIAIQGELMGPNIQGNREQLKDFTLFVFDVQFLDEGRKATPMERYSIMDRLYALGVNPHKVRHAPIFADGKFREFQELSAEERVSYRLPDLGLHSTSDLLKFAEGPSLVNKVREGVVFKRITDEFSFKAISDAYLLGEKE